MRVLILSRQGDGLDLAIDAKRDGHDCRCWIQDPKCKKEALEGLVQKVDDFKTCKGWAELVVCDANGLADEWSVVKTWGIPVYGGSPEGQRMEKDRSYAHDLMESAGMKPLDSVTYKTIEEAIKAISGEKGLRVCKVVGGQASSEGVIISEREDAADAIELMTRFKESGKKYDVVEVEERIIGIEMGCAGYFNGKDWVGPIELNWQHKEVAAGWPGSDRGQGVLCGETGTVIKYVSKDNAFFKKTMALFTEHLKKVGYVGEFDVGCMVNEKGIYPIEFTPRFGYPDLFIRRALASSSQMDFFAACARGETAELETIPGWAIGFLVMVPGFPYEEAVIKHSMGYPVYGYDEKNPGMHLMEVKNGQRGLVVNKGTGYAAVVSARGDTIEAARRNAAWLVDPRNAKRLYIPKASIRVDIGERVLDQQEAILDLGLMTAEEWGE